jgi:hypothetical protein
MVNGTNASWLDPSTKRVIVHTNFQQKDSVLCASLLHSQHCLFDVSIQEIVIYFCFNVWCCTHKCCGKNAKEVNDYDDYYYYYYHHNN